MKKILSLSLAFLFILAALPVQGLVPDVCNLENRIGARRLDPVDFMSDAERLAVRWYWAEGVSRSEDASDAGNGLIGYTTQNLPQFTHTDPLGSITAITSADGSLLESRTYQPFGASEVSQQGNNDLPDTYLTSSESSAGDVFIGDIPAMLPGDAPIQNTIQLQAPASIDPEDPVWLPDLSLGLGEGPQTVFLPVAPIPLTMVTDLSPPYLKVERAAADPLYLIEDGDLSYTITVDPDLETFSDTLLSVTLPDTVTVISAPGCDDPAANPLTWSIGPLTAEQTFTLIVNVLFLQNRNSLIVPQVELTALDASYGPVHIPGNRVHTPVLNEGFAFFAEPTVATGPIASATPTELIDFDCFIIFLGESSQNTRSFIAKEIDPSTGLINFGVRPYDQDLGRFTTVDPFEGYFSDPRSLHRYNYAFNNPLVYFDLYGFVTYTEHGGVNYFENITEGKNYYLDWAGYFVSDFMSLNPLAENIAKTRSSDVSTGQKIWSGTKAGAQVGMELLGGKVISGGAKLAGKGLKSVFNKAVTNRYLADISKKVGKVATETAQAIGNKLNELRLDEVGKIDVLEPIRRLTGKSSKAVVKESTEIAEEATQKVMQSATKSGGKPQYLKDIEYGNNFNKAHQFDYPYRELYLEKPGGGYIRVDAYDDVAGEIISRKATQLGNIQESTAINYLRELSNKYPSGSTIANVPSSGPLSGQVIRGQLILEIPIQTKPIPAAVLNEARRLNIVIRDVAGTIYR